MTDYYYLNGRVRYDEAKAARLKELAAEFSARDGITWNMSDVIRLALDNLIRAHDLDHEQDFLGTLFARNLGRSGG